MRRLVVPTLLAAVACSDDGAGEPCRFAGATRCSSLADAMQTCGDDRTWGSAVSCDDGPCRDGECRRLICEEGDKRCEGLELLVCQQGLRWESLFACNVGSRCDADSERCVRVSPGGAGREICDGRDNDADGEIDEDPAGSLCPEGHLCAGEAGCLVAELCDGEDNDEDGETDEGARCPELTECERGHCFGMEVCDGDDNDEDGQVDEGAMCPANGTCVLGNCTGDPY